MTSQYINSIKHNCQNNTSFQESNARIMIFWDMIIRHKYWNVKPRRYFSRFVEYFMSNLINNVDLTLLRMARVFRALKLISGIPRVYILTSFFLSVNTCTHYVTPLFSHELMNCILWLRINALHVVWCFYYNFKFLISI